MLSIRTADRLITRLMRVEVRTDVPERIASRRTEKTSRLVLVSRIGHGSLERRTIGLRTRGAPLTPPSPRRGEGDRFCPPPRDSRWAEANTLPFSPAGRKCPKGG